MTSVLGTCDAFYADRDITLLTVSFASLIGVRCTLREHQLDCALCEGNDVMLHRFEAVDVFVDAICTQTDLAAIAELLDRLVTV
jgi:hypothetical protein